MLRLTVLLNDRQLAYSLKFDEIRAETRQQAQGLSGQMTALVEALSKLTVSQLAGTNLDAPKVTKASTADDEAGASEPLLITPIDFQQLSDKVSELLRASSGPSPEMRILKQLYFPSMYHREDYMRSAEEGTFEWLLTNDKSDEHSLQPVHKQDEDDQDKDDPEGKYTWEDAKRRSASSRLLKWLRDGHGVFHIVGKAGAGKSTLMKLLVRHDRLREELQHWAGGATLLFGHFFFWRSGDKTQNSLEGLFRSILFETLSKSPELLPHVFPEAYRKFSQSLPGDCIEALQFRPEHLKSAVQRLVKLSVPNDCRLCLVIDGLDEYGEDARDKQQHEDLAKLLLQWGTSEKVKLLVSSRPEKEFIDAFSDPDQCMKLHLLTRRDVRLYTRQSLKRHRYYHRIKTHSARLTREVVSRAEGVFVWAKFAVSTICQNASEGWCDIEELLDALSQLPDDMEEIYLNILKSQSSPKQRERAVKLLQAVCFSSELKLHPLVVLHIDRWHDPDFPFTSKRQEWTNEEFRQNMEKAVDRVNALSRGLIEIIYPHQMNSPVDAYLQPFHRTLLDFVQGNRGFKAVSTQNEESYTRKLLTRIWLTVMWFYCAEHDVDACQTFVRSITYGGMHLSASVLDTAFRHDWLFRLAAAHIAMRRPRLTHLETIDPVWSFPHWALCISNLKIPDMLLKTWALAEGRGEYPDNLSLVVSAASHSHAPAERVLSLLPNLHRRFLLSHVRRQCKGEECADDLPVTVWIGSLMSIVARTTHRYPFEALLAIIGAALQAEVDCDFYLLFGEAGESLVKSISVADWLQGVSGWVDRIQGTSWQEKFDERLATTKLTRADDELWSQHGLELVGHEEFPRWRHELQIVGLARVIDDRDASSVSLDITWTRCYRVRLC